MMRKTSATGRKVICTQVARSTANMDMTAAMTPSTALMPLIHKGMNLPKAMAMEGTTSCRRGSSTAAR